MNLQKNNLVWIEISKKALEKNIKTIRKVIGSKVLLAACVKSNAYGHGIREISGLISDFGVDWFCVFSIEEAKVLRKNGIQKPILVMGFVGGEDYPDILNLKLRVFIWDKQQAENLSKFAVKKKKIAYAHIKIDTGLNRMGVLLSELGEFLNFVKGLKGICVEGIATHFACEPQKAYSKNQLKIFKELDLSVDSELLFHCAKSNMALLERGSHFNMVRCGLSLYGYYSSDNIKNKCLEKGLNLQPTLTLKTKIIGLKKISKNCFVGYDCTERVKRDTRAALLPIGYSDGLDRRLSSRGYVLIKGKRAKILGRIAMNLTVVDATDISGLKVGEEVVVMGNQGREEITVEELANIVGTINYEIIARLREGIPRHVVD